MLVFNLHKIISVRRCTKRGKFLYIEGFVWEIHEIQSREGPQKLEKSQGRFDSGNWTCGLIGDICNTFVEKTKRNKLSKCKCA